MGSSPPWEALKASQHAQQPPQRIIKPLPASSFTAQTAQLTPTAHLRSAAAPPSAALSELEFEPGQPAQASTSAKLNSRPAVVQKDSAASDGDGSEPAEGVFGAAGRVIARSLGEASSFSTAGLFGALPQIAHSQLRPQLARSLSPMSSSRSAFEADEGSPAPAVSGYDSPLGAGGVDGLAGECVLVDGGEGDWPQGRSNKKKRKVPVPASASFSHYAEDGRTDVDDDVGQSTDSFFPRRALQVPANPPRTAEAALAKLRERAPHVSIVPSSLSRQRANLEREQPHRLQPPLDLPSPPVYHPPPRQTKGPPSLPPGSGLKGSKAVKAAIKAEKEREAERKRLLRDIGAENFVLVDLFDPTGVERARHEQLSRLRARPPALGTATGHRARQAPADSLKIDGYPTPPPSSDESDEQHDGVMPWLEHFSFSVPPSKAVLDRWDALQEQIEQLRFAEERALKAREEERDRRLDKARKTLEELEREASALAAKKEAKTKPSPPSPATPAQRTPSSLRAPSMSPTISREELPPLPPQPPSVKPKKKGGKKRTAHANANNPHFKSNYIPSRMPASAHTPTNQHDDGSLLTSWPASQAAFDAAAAAGVRTAGGDSYFAAEGEFLCSWCDYEAFYGEEPLFIRAIKRREDVLRRRKKSEKKAAAKLTNAAPAPADPLPGTEPINEPSSLD